MKNPKFNKDPSGYVVRAGANFLITDKNFDGSVHHVDKIVNYEEKNRTSGYKGLTPFSRLVLMRVKEPFKFDETRKPIKLLKTGEEFVPGTIANVSGFGVFDLFHKRLQSAEVPLINLDTCNKTYRVDIYLTDNFGAHVGIPQGYVCADYSENTRSINSYYDGAGSLTVHDRLVGILSVTPGARQFSKNPKLFIDVAYHRE